MMPPVGRAHTRPCHRAERGGDQPATGQHGTKARYREYAQAGQQAAGPAQRRADLGAGGQVLADDVLRLHHALGAIGDQADIGSR